MVASIKAVACVGECGMAQVLGEALQNAIDREVPRLQAITDDAAVKPAGQREWSRKEELGHLIDSATNNHVRFVRGALEPEFRGPGYDQEGWVGLHGYNELPWVTLIDFWRRYNSLLAHLVARIPEDRLQTRCVVGTGAAVTLGFLIEDYILHMQHHLDHILGREEITQYPGAALGV
jgi:hypothetical protein